MSHLMIPGTEALGRPEPHIDVFAIQGEMGTGFEKAGDLGEFECGNCRYFDAAAGACDQGTMKTWSKQPRLADGRVSVSDEDCCEYVFRVGKQDNDNEKTDE